MNTLRRLLIVSALVILPLATAVAEGGFSWGEQYFVPELASYNLSSQYTSVFGYGVTRGGQRMGGFVLGVHSPDGGGQISGGVVGSILGQEMRDGPVMLAASLWTGIGSVRTAALSEQGDISLFGELSLEAGFTVPRWMQIVAYGGMQVVANVGNGAPFDEVPFFTPVLGLRLVWGL
jgi:hypothetical protein